jgi:GrpB-like predicted nucleotidyltransferase (UPF0157 family)
MRRIEVVDYDPSWPNTFESLCARLWPALADVALSIEHVGSTSVPGLAAKPIIDISSMVPENPDVPIGISRLATLGYIHRGDLGIKGREAFTNRRQDYYAFENASSDWLSTRTPSAN